MTSHISGAVHLGKRMSFALLGIFIIAIPGAVLSATLIPRITGVVMIGVMPAINGVIAGGSKLGLRLVIVTAPLGAIAVLVSPYPIGATLFIAVVSGYAALWARRGLSSPVLMIPVALAFLVSEPGHFVAGRTLAEGSWQLALLTAAGLLIGGVWAVVLGGLALRKLPRRPLEKMEKHAANHYALAVAIATGLATWFATAVFPNTSAAWAILTVILVLKPDVHETKMRTFHRVAGTLGGAALAGIILALASAWSIPAPLITVLGLVLLSAALAIVASAPYWKYVLLLTPGIVLLEGADQLGYQLTFERIAFTLLGAALALAVGFLVIHAGKLMRHSR